MMSLGRTVSHKKTYLKACITVLLVLFCLWMIYYFSYRRGIHTVYTQFFYIPIALTGFWWGRKNIGVALLLGAALMLPHVLDPTTSVNDDLLRTLMFVIVAVIISSLRIRTIKYEQEIKQILNTSVDGMRLIDRNFNTIKINYRFAELTGLKGSEILGKKCYETFRGPVCHTDGCPLTRIINGAGRITEDVEKVRPDGNKIPCIVTATPFLGPKGEIIGIVEDFRDITERKKAEEKLKEQKEFAENLIHNSTVPTFVLNPRHEVIIWNKACEELTSVKASEVLGTNRHWTAFFMMWNAHVFPILL